MARATPCFHSIDFYVTAQPSLILSLYAPRYCLTASAGFGRQFTKLRALSRLRRRYGSKKESFPSFPSFHPPQFPNPYLLYKEVYIMEALFSNVLNLQ